MFIGGRCRKLAEILLFAQTVVHIDVGLWV